MKFKKEHVVVLLVAVAVIAIGWLMFTGQQRTFGGTTNYDELDVSDGYKVDGSYVVNGVGQYVGAINTTNTVSTGLLTAGGGVFATSSTGAGTLTAANLFAGNIIQHTNAGATTITLPASSTVTSFITTAGQCRSVLFKNLGTGTDTLAGGTGTFLRVASSTISSGLKTVLADGVADLKICRLSTTDIEVFMSPAI